MANAAPPNASDSFLVSESHLLLNQARREKSERTKTVGDPIQLPGTALSIKIREDGFAWVADNTHVVRKLDLETGRTAAIYRGHTGPVTCIEFYQSAQGQDILISGAWDKTIKLWDLKDKHIISSTRGHDDFVKALFAFPTIALLVSGSSDNIVRFWDLSNIGEGRPMQSAGSISGHTRPVECLDGKVTSTTSAVLCTGDTMGVIKIWEISKDTGDHPTRWRATLQSELYHHRTRVNELIYSPTQLWTASSDETVQIVPSPLQATASTAVKKTRSIAHRAPARCLLPLSLTDLAEPYVITGAGDLISVYDVSSPESPELVQEVDAHWHDVTILRLWIRKRRTEDGRTSIEPWIISASLDGTIRKWRLLDLLNPSAPQIDNSAKSEAVPENQIDPEPSQADSGLTEDEERELAELMDAD